MNSRRFIASPEARDKASYQPELAHQKRLICSQAAQMSALGQKEDMCGAKGHVR
jgi:hypothetical protein